MDYKCASSSKEINTTDKFEFDERQWVNRRGMKLPINKSQWGNFILDVLYLANCIHESMDRLVNETLQLL